VLPGKGLKEFIKVKAVSKRLSYRMMFYSLLFFTFLLRFVFVLTAVDGIDGENKCSTIGTLSPITRLVKLSAVTILRIHRS
jgi:alpha-1,4-galacturonosyltransferase